MSVILQWARSHLRSLRRSLWRFFRPAAFSLPLRPSSALPRLRRNLSSFRVYYSVLLWVLLLLSLFLRRHRASMLFLMASSKVALLYEILLKSVPLSWSLLRRLLDRRRIVLGIFLLVVFAELTVTHALDCLAIDLAAGGILVLLHALLRSEDFDDGAEHGGGAGDKEKDADLEEGASR